MSITDIAVSGMYLFILGGVVYCYVKAKWHQYELEDKYHLKENKQ